MNLIEQVIAGLIVAAICYGIKDAFSERRLLALVARIPRLGRMIGHYERLQRLAIDNEKWPLDFYAWNFAYLIPFAAFTVIIAGDMSNAFFNENVGWGWYICLSVVSFPISYVTGLMTSVIGSVSSQRLEYWAVLVKESSETSADNASNIPGKQAYNNSGDSNCDDKTA